MYNSRTANCYIVEGEAPRESASDCPSVARAEMSRRVRDSFVRLERANLSWRSVTNSRLDIYV